MAKVADGSERKGNLGGGRKGEGRETVKTYSKTLKTPMLCIRMFYSNHVYCINEFSFLFVLFACNEFDMMLIFVRSCDD